MARHLRGRRPGAPGAWTWDQPGRSKGSRRPPAPTPSRFLRRLQVFVEPDAVAERVDDLHAPGVVEGHLQPRSQVLVVLRRKLPVELLDARHPDEDGRAGAAVAVMLRQVQHQAVPGHLHVSRGVLLEVVVPIDGEAEVIDVELLRLPHAEDAQDRDRPLERYRHCGPPSSHSRGSAKARVYPSPSRTPNSLWP